MIKRNIYDRIRGYKKEHNFYCKNCKSEFDVENSINGSSAYDAARNMSCLICLANNEQQILSRKEYSDYSKGLL